MEGFLYRKVFINILEGLEVQHEEVLEEKKKRISACHSWIKLDSPWAIAHKPAFLEVLLFLAFKSY